MGEIPRYYFDLHNGVEARDDEGQELPSFEEARLHAIELVRFEAAEAVKRQGHLVKHHRIDIKDANGFVLDTVRFGDAVKIEG